MGGVLVYYKEDEAMKKAGIPAEDRDAIEKNFYGAGYIDLTDRGLKTHKEVIEECSLPERIKQELREMYIEHCYGLTYMYPFDNMLGLVKELKSNGYKIYLLSNAGVDFYVYSPHYPVMEYLNGKFVSCEYLLLKPERAIYEKFFSVFSLNPSECVFIDDRQKNVDGSIKAGMDAIRFSSADEDIEVLKEKLREKGVKI